MAAASKRQQQQQSREGSDNSSSELTTTKRGSAVLQYSRCGVGDKSASLLLCVYTASSPQQRL